MALPNPKEQNVNRYSRYDDHRRTYDRSSVRERWIVQAFSLLFLAAAVGLAALVVVKVFVPQLRVLESVLG